MPSPFPKLAPALSLTALVVAAPAISMAQDWDDQPSSPWALGVAAAAGDSPYKGYDNDVTGFPMVVYHGQHVQVTGNTVDLKFPASEQWSFALRGRYAIGEGYKGSDAPILRGMDKRRASFWLGAAATWNGDYARISAEVLGDASGNSKGVRGSVSVEHDFRLGSGWTLTPRMAILYSDKSYVDYYYGVTEREATSARPAYEGDSAINVQVGLRTAYAFTEHQSVFLDVSATALDESIRDSPLVDKDFIPAVAMGYVYRF